MIERAKEVRAHRLTIEGLTKSYGGRLLPGLPSRPVVAVLDGISFCLEPGEIMALRGVNGSGKTTLLKIIARLITPDRGSAIVDSNAVGFSSGEERSLSWRLTALHNLEFFGVLQGMTPAAARREGMLLLDCLGLADRARRRVQELSSGQKQRLLVARAFMGSPGLVLLDEPTSRMDEESIEAVWSLFQERAAEGTTIVLATHSDEDERRADVVMTLPEGGPPVKTSGHLGRAPLERRVPAPTNDGRVDNGADPGSRTVRRLWAFFRRDLAITLSYPMGLALQVFGSLVGIPFLFFLSHLIGGRSHYLQVYGGSYFAFAVLGTAVFSLQAGTTTAMTRSVRENQLTGTLEAMLATRARLPTVLIGCAFWGIVFATLQVPLLLVPSILFFGLHLKAAWGIPLLVVMLSLLASLGVGLTEAGFVLLFKRGGPVNITLMTASNLLGGVLYPVGVLPAQLRWISPLLPITHTANALRFGLSAGNLHAALAETAALSLLMGIYLAGGVLATAWAYALVRKWGTLSQY